jgi:hypothetical protein
MGVMGAGKGGESKEVKVKQGNERIMKRTF